MVIFCHVFFFFFFFVWLLMMYCSYYTCSMLDYCLIIIIDIMKALQLVYVFYVSPFHCFGIMPIHMYAEAAVVLLITR